MIRAESFQRLLRRFMRGLFIVGVALLLALGALWATLRVALMPQPGEWATEIGRGPFTLQASVPQLVWLATTPSFGPLLHGLRVHSPLGPVTLGWIAAGQEGPEPVLTLHCEPCTLPLPAALTSAPLRVPALQLALSRDQVQHLRGTLLLGAHDPQGGDAVVAATWRARRQGAGWGVRLHWPDAPARHWFALLAPGLPELAVARIDGRIGADAELQLPARTLQVTPRVQGLAVSGLGTQAWANARSSCGPHQRHAPRGWLTRAVLAAEDQRFFEHPGYDLTELLASLDANQQHAAIRRGGSTITQQVAKLMVAGDERTLARKLRELLYAVEIEQTLGKARILQLYLNLAPWGQNAEGRLVCGAAAAARHYFQIPARRLTPRQAVTLAAMLHNPAREAERWASEGSVNRGRLTWIAEQVRGVPLRQRRALLALLKTEQEEQAAPAHAVTTPLAQEGDAPVSAMRLAGAPEE